jgi:hypothetical protein
VGKRVWPAWSEGAYAFACVRHILFGTDWPAAPEPTVVRNIANLTNFDGCTRLRRHYAMASPPLRTDVPGPQPGPGSDGQIISGPPNPGTVPIGISASAMTREVNTRNAFRVGSCAISGLRAAKRMNTTPTSNATIVSQRVQS